MSIYSLITAMQSAGVSPEKIVETIKIAEKEEEEKRLLKKEKDRLRKRAEREKSLNINNHVQGNPRTAQDIQDGVDKVSPPCPPFSLSPTPPITIPPLTPHSNPSDDVNAQARAIFDYLEKIINSPLPLFSSPVSAWLIWGADFEMDIKPVAERWKKRNPVKAMNSLSWLDDDIAKSIQQRNKPMPEPEVPPPRQEFKSFAKIAEEKTEENLEKVRARYAIPK